jgi:uncharacterized protein (TIGR03437 family)
MLPLTPLKAVSVQTLAYTKNSGTPAYVDVPVASNLPSLPNPFFSVYPSSVPFWLTPSIMTGTASTTEKVRFSTSSLADTLAPGNYSATVVLQVAGYGDLDIVFNLQVSNPNPTLLWTSNPTASGTTVTLASYMAGTTSYPSLSITLSSSDSPIPYSIAFGGALAPYATTTADQKGFAYNFGTPIPISFGYAWAAAVPGTPVTGTISITWGSQNTVSLINISVPVTAPGATLTGISPASLPTATAGTFTLGLIGTGFVGNSGSSSSVKPTLVGTMVSSTFTKDASIVIANVTPTLMTLTLSATDTAFPFAAGGSVTLGVCNPAGSATTCTPGAGATYSLIITASPLIQAITSASTFSQVTAPAHPTLAPYDLISIFGTGFCNTCASGTAINGALTANDFYPVSISDTSSPAKAVSVAFYTQGSTTSPLATAPMLFLSSNQINAVVPSTGLTTGTNYDVIVTYGATTSNSFTITLAAQDPGIFTVGSDGLGNGAILNSANWTLISSSNPGGVRATTASDFVSIYMTGLGIPLSTAHNTSGGNLATIPGDCITTDNTNGYLAAVNSVNNGTALSSLDGAIIQSSLIDASRLAPCLTTNPVVTVGGQPATVSYAGWVKDSIAGLYQVNAKLPATSALNLTSNAPVQLPVVVSFTGSGASSQTAGVTMWVAPRLQVLAPAALTGTVGQTWPTSGNLVVASDGATVATYSYSLSSGVLPNGLVLDPVGGGISGTPAAYTGGTYPVTVTATDSELPIPLTGTATFSLIVNAGLVVSVAPVAPADLSGTTLTMPAITTGTIGTVQANGGTPPYVYTDPSSTLGSTHLSINSSTGVITDDGSAPTNSTGASVVITVTDANGLVTTFPFTLILD